MSRSPGAPRRAVSLIELMVVIAIITTLTGILLPGVHHARRSARASTSTSNLRQMAVASQMYVTWWDEWITAVRYESNGGLRTIAWDFEQHADGTVVPGPLWAHTDDPGRVMQCPEFAGASTFGADPHTGYNYNTSYIGGEATFPGVGWDAVRPGVRPSGCRRTATTALFGAGGWLGGANKFMRAPGNPENQHPMTTYAGAQAFRYVGRRTVVAYLDGHVDSVMDADPGPTEDAALLESPLGFPANGFLGPDDRSYDPR